MIGEMLSVITYYGNRSSSSYTVIYQWYRAHVILRNRKVEKSMDYSQHLGYCHILVSISLRLWRCLSYSIHL